jgi:hypothetical protein
METTDYKWQDQDNNECQMHEIHAWGSPLFSTATLNLDKRFHLHLIYCKSDSERVNVTEACKQLKAEMVHPRDLSM